MHELISVGRISVDLYPNEIGSSFAGPQTFVKTIGGSPTSVAVAAARLGRSSALVTKVGAGPLGRYAARRLSEYGVDTTYVGTDERGTMPVVLASLTPPDAPEIVFFRSPGAPDTTLLPDDVPYDAIRECGVLWISACAMAEGTTAEACVSWMRARSGQGHTILDLDYRPTFWASEDATRAVGLAAIAEATVVVGNEREYEVVLGLTDPDAVADRLLELGSEIAVVKMGPQGVLLATRTERHRIQPIPIDVVCGLGSGDAFGGALVHGLLAGWSLDRIGEYGNAAGAIVATEIMCCDANPTLSQIEDMLAANGRLG